MASVIHCMQALETVRVYPVLHLNASVMPSCAPIIDFQVPQLNSPNLPLPKGRPISKSAKLHSLVAPPAAGHPDAAAVDMPSFPPAWHIFIIEHSHRGAADEPYSTIWFVARPCQVRSVMSILLGLWLCSKCQGSPKELSTDRSGR